MWNIFHISNSTYGVATMSRMLKNIGLFCKRALQKRIVFCKETCIFKHPTHRSHPISKYVEDIPHILICGISMYICGISTYSHIYIDRQTMTLFFYMWNIYVCMWNIYIYIILLICGISVIYMSHMSKSHICPTRQRAIYVPHVKSWYMSHISKSHKINFKESFQRVISKSHIYVPHVKEPYMCHMWNRDICPTCQRVSPHTKES